MSLLFLFSYSIFLIQFLRRHFLLTVFYSLAPFLLYSYSLPFFLSSFLLLLSLLISSAIPIFLSLSIISSDLPFILSSFLFSFPFFFLSSSSLPPPFSLFFSYPSLSFHIYFKIHPHSFFLSSLTSFPLYSRILSILSSSPFHSHYSFSSIFTFPSFFLISLFRLFSPSSSQERQFHI